MMMNTEKHATRLTALIHAGVTAIALPLEALPEHVQAELARRDEYTILLDLPTGWVSAVARNVSHHNREAWDEVDYKLGLELCDEPKVAKAVKAALKRCAKDLARRARKAQEKAEAKRILAELLAQGSPQRLAA